MADELQIEAEQPPVSLSVLSFQGLEILQHQRRVLRDRRDVRLTRLEYGTLVFLSSSPNRVFTQSRIFEMVFRAVGLPVKLADKYAPAYIGRFLNRRLPLAPLDYGETCACLFRDITYTQHLHFANRVVEHTHRLCGQIKAALWLLSERKVH